MGFKVWPVINRSSNWLRILWARESKLAKGCCKSQPLPNLQNFLNLVGNFIETSSELYREFCRFAIRPKFSTKFPTKVSEASSALAFASTSFYHLTRTAGRP